jgi:hypothetical protein
MIETINFSSSIQGRSVAVILFLLQVTAISLNPESAHAEERKERSFCNLTGKPEVVSQENNETLLTDEEREQSAAEQVSIYHAKLSGWYVEEEDELGETVLERASRFFSCEKKEN